MSQCQMSQCHHVLMSQCTLIQFMRSGALTQAQGMHGRALGSVALSAYHHVTAHTEWFTGCMVHCMFTRSDVVYACCVVMQNQGSREGAIPLNFFVRELGKWGFRADGLEYAKATFVAPCTIMMEANVADLVAARKRLKQSQAQEHEGNVSIAGGIKSRLQAPHPHAVALPPALVASLVALFYLEAHEHVLAIKLALKARCPLSVTCDL